MNNALRRKHRIDELLAKRAPIVDEANLLRDQADALDLEAGDIWSDILKLQRMDEGNEDR